MPGRALKWDRPLAKPPPARRARNVNNRGTRPRGERALPHAARGRNRTLKDVAIIRGAGVPVEVTSQPSADHGLLENDARHAARPSARCVPA